MSEGKKPISNALLFVIGLILGSACALIWYFGPVFYVRDMLPFALSFEIVILMVTAILKANCGYSVGDSVECCHMSQTCTSLRKYSLTILISSVVSILFSMVVIASYFSFTVRVILAFVGAISFWTMLLAFIAMIGYILYRRRP